MASVAGVDVSRETFEALEAFADLTVKWTARINLIAKSTVSSVWERHIVDSAQLFPLAPAFSHWVDLGSGGGFPGIVIAILAKEISPEARVTLVESDVRKATFLRTASRDFNLAVTVLASRVETLAPQEGDIVSARAFTSLADLLPLAERHMAEQGTALFPKGRRYAEEIASIPAHFAYEFTEHPSITDAQSRILKYKRISRVA